MPVTEYYRSLWTDFVARSRRLAAGEAPRDAIDTSISWQLGGVTPHCQHPLGLEDLHLPELHSGAPWLPNAVRPSALGSRWVAFVALNPGLTETESFPRVRHLNRGHEAELLDFFDMRFATRYRARPLRRGRRKGKVCCYEERTGAHRASQTWSVLDNLMADALAGLHLTAPLGDVAAIVDAVPYKFRKWSAAPSQVRRELLEVSLPMHFDFMRALAPTAVVLMGTDTHSLLDHMPIVAGAPAAVVDGVRCEGFRTLGDRGFTVEVFACYHPTSRAWSAAGSRARLTAWLREHLLQGGVGQ